MAPDDNDTQQQRTAQKTPIRLHHVHKSFGRGSERVSAIEEMNLEIESGGVTAVLGPNGAGKTTTVRMMLGLSEPDRGTVEVFGGDPSALEQRMRVGAMLQISGLPDTLRVIEHIRLFRSYYPSPLSVETILEIAGLEHLARRYYGKLSGGERQRLAFALAICGDPDLLFLDEPTVGLDVQSRRSFWSQIRQLVDRGKTIVLTTHYLEEADALADRIVVLNRGRIIADASPAEIKQRTGARRVRCRTSLRPFEVRDRDLVIEAIAEGEYLEMISPKPERLLRFLLERDPKLSDLEVTGIGLEQAFLDLTESASRSSEEEKASNRSSAA